jgi:hypothetical protein
MPHQRNGTGEVNWATAARGIVEDAKAHPALVFQAFTLLLLTVILGALVWFGHVERDHRQTWIETKLESITSTSNVALAEVRASIGVQAETNREVKQQLELTLFELRETRKALLVVRDMLMQKVDAQ